MKIAIAPGLFLARGGCGADQPGPMCRVTVAQNYIDPERVDGTGAADQAVITMKQADGWKMLRLKNNLFPIPESELLERPVSTARLRLLRALNARTLYWKRLNERGADEQ